MKKSLKNRVASTIAYMLPWRVMYWVIIRAWSYTTTHEASHKSPDQTTWTDVIRSWEAKTGTKI